MEIRKLVKSGPGSHALSLPKKWLVKHQISKGDLLYITEGQGETLTISPTLHKPKAKRPCCEIDASEDILIIQRKILSAYIDSCDTITISGVALTADDLAVVRETVNELAGLEIMLHTPKHILIKDVLNVHELSIRENVRKMDVIIQLMFADLRKAVQGEDVAAVAWERDERELNKLYFLTFRLIKIAIGHAETREREQLDTFHLISHLRLIVILEDIGDHIKAICAALAKRAGGKVVELMPICTVLEKEYREMVAAYYQRNREAAYRYYIARRTVQELCDAYAIRNRNTIIAAVLQKIKQMAKSTEDISKIIRYL